jgi:hypothetical protein
MDLSGGSILVAIAVVVFFLGEALLRLLTLTGDVARFVAVAVGVAAGVIGVAGLIALL